MDIDNQREHEDAMEMRLGSEFADAAPLCVSQVIKMIERKESMAKKDSSEFASTPQAASVLAKTKAYCLRIQSQRMESDDTQLFSALLRPLESSRNAGELLHPFEVASLINLAPETAEEAKAIVPSLARFDDLEVDYYLQTMAQHGT
eukprot:NODE_4304_length_831_cov_22.563939_g3976_i0.p1 GENE.NODE_4304_length_831_cov_22.563939_g3976_i0~~NODE_4304_length_831_cov_22.563939_g3976_i0.p1  ORF type:complete len:147 (-),score=46.46 NODE_4304_length_831_cov_22.563939_g3976_i0:213-653(-)